MLTIYWGLVVRSESSQHYKQWNIYVPTPEDRYKSRPHLRYKGAFSPHEVRICFYRNRRDQRRGRT